MEKSIEEVLDASSRLLAEMKSGTRERTILSSVTKGLKHRVQDWKQSSRNLGQITPSKTSKVTHTSTPATPPARMPAALPPGADTSSAVEKATAALDTSSVPVNAAFTPATGAKILERARGTPVGESSAAAAAAESSYAPVQQFLCDEEEVSKLAYACRIAIIGENGSINRSSPRMLTASLELAAVVLTSGILPLELVTPVPVFAISESTMTGAQVFFSKLLGGRKHSTGSEQKGSAHNTTPDGRAPGTGARLSPTVEEKAMENMRDELVDAVLAAVDAAQTKESSDRLHFVTIASLMACAVPRLSRKSCAELKANELHSQQLSVHGEQLVRVFRVLLTWCSRPQGLSPILVDEAQKAIHGITRALSKYVEYEAIGWTGASGSKDHGKPPKSLPEPQEKQQQQQPSAVPPPPQLDSSTASSSTATSVAATPLMPLPTAVGRATRSGMDTFADPLALHNDDGDAATMPPLSPNSSFPITTPIPVADVQRSASVDATVAVATTAVTSAGATATATATTTVPLLAAPRPLRGVHDMGLLLELCGNVARLTPLSGITPSVSSSSGGGGIDDGDTYAISLGGNVNGDAAGSTGSSGAMVLAGRDGGSSSSTTSFPVQYLNTYTLVTSLSFILYAVVNSGPQFRRSAEIVQLLRLVVVPAAVRTSVSNDLDLFRLSINLLLLCCLRFGPQMVNETSTVFSHVYFRVLDSAFTSLEQKMLILDAFASYIEEPQLLLGLFLNYDCNTHSQSIYEMMIHYLGALAMPPAQSTFNGNLAAELKRVLTVRLEYDVPEVLRRKALVRLLQVSDSNIQWIERFECDQDEDGRDSSASSATHAHTGAGAKATEMTGASLSDDADPKSGRDGEAALRRSDTSGHVTVGADGANTNADTFLQARRYKDAFRKFLDLFNDKAMPEAAIEYLKSSLLTLDDTEADMPATATTATTEPKAAANIAAAKTEAAAAVAPAATAVVEKPGKEENKASSNSKEAEEKKEEEGETEPVKADSTHPAGDGKKEGEVAAASPPAAAENPGFSEAVVATAATPVVSDVDDAMRHSARRVAIFLKQNEDYIDKMILGDYFAKSFRKPATRVIFEEWIAQHDFTGLTLDAALRLFLGGFKLLGEAQVVDRTMELFAAQYCRQNHGVFSSADTAFILSFSICMLNTDAHSPHIKNKMTKEGFLQNNKGIDEGNDVDPAILGGIYDRISKDEIVLRPSPRCFTQLLSKKAADSGKRGDIKVTTSLLDSIPLLRHLAPIAAAITDKVLLPMDAAGYALFNSSQRKREEMYQRELRASLKAVMDALQEASANDAAHHAMFVTATSIENALPMWEVTVDVVCHIVLLSLQQILEDSEKYIRPPSFSLPTNNSEKDACMDYDPVAMFMQDTKSAGFFSTMLTGLYNTVRVCCSFGNVTHTEQLLAHTFEMTHLSSVVAVSALPSARVIVQSTLPFTRLHLLSTFLNLFVQCGASFNSRGWQAAYKAMSLMDALANGVEGMWRRQARRLLGSALATHETGFMAPANPANGAAAPLLSSPGKRLDKLDANRATTNNSSDTKNCESSNANGANSAAGTAVTTAPESGQRTDLWFGALNDIPHTIVDRASRENRKSILSGLRAAPSSHVDLWLDHLFDTTQYPSRVQLEMTNGLVKVCEMELQYGRTFSLTKLFDMVSICASFSSRLQWRDLWTHASDVFTLAGCGTSTEIALSSLDGLRLIALTYLMREELLNYSFQKEVLKPFEAILMSNQNVSCRQKVMTILSELIDFRAEHLASGWNVVFSCLSHAAAIPDVAPHAWSICEGIMGKHIAHLKDCFNDLIFCLTTFACSGVEESMPLRAISYLVACGHWLQYGLEAPPSDVRAADTVARWAVRFHTAELELATARMLGKHLSRVTLATEPLTREALLQKPTSFITKTKYHLWMSLFEGMVPIVVVHSSVRVRAHALSSIWALLAQYASLFDEEVQNSLFSGMVRPMLTTLVTHVPEDVDVSSPPMAGCNEFDRFDYRLLVYFALKGMLLSCSSHAHLLSLACKALVELVETTKISLRMISNDYVAEVLRVCFDFVWAAPSLAMVDVLKQLAPMPTTSLFNGDSESCVERLYQWIPAELHHGNPFVVGLVHEIQQVGVVDVVRFKRTAGWTELHQTPAAQNLPVSIDLSALSTTSVESVSSTIVQIRSAIYGCLTQGLMAQLRKLLIANEGDRDACLFVTGEARHVLLGISYYFLVTRDARAVAFLKSVMPIACDHALKSVQYDMQDNAAGKGDAGVTNPAAGPIGEDASSSAPTPTTPALTSPSPAFFNSPKDIAIEAMLLIPYTWVLLEFIATFNLGDADRNVVCNDLGVYVAHCLDEMERARQMCVGRQGTVRSITCGEAGGTNGTEDEVTIAGAGATSAANLTSPPPPSPPTQSSSTTNSGGVGDGFATRGVMAAASAATNAKNTEVHGGLNFCDVFRSACYPIASRSYYLTPQTPTVVQDRICAEWRYLLHVYAIKCVAILGNHSVLLQTCSTRDLVELLCRIPSSLEEKASRAFLDSCWEEMNLHCCMPSSTCMELCTSLIVSRV